MVYLRPEGWVGKRLPLLGHIRIGEELGRGRWVVVIYSSYCGHCRPAVPEYEQLAIAMEGKAGAPRVALVEVPPVAPTGKNRASGVTPAAVGHLSEERKWLVATPVVLAVVEGKVVGLAGNEPAEGWARRVFGEW